MENLFAALKQWQANSVVLSSTAHGFHWNVEGPLFSEFHELFGEYYEDVDKTIDEIAEWLRRFDVVAPYTLTDFINNTNYQENRISSNSPLTMTRTLSVMNDKMINDIKNIFDLATQEREQGLANFLADRQDKHEKWGWIFRSILKPTVN